jgi:hypothetical protein
MVGIVGEDKTIITLSWHQFHHCFACGVIQVNSKFSRVATKCRWPGPYSLISRSPGGTPPRFRTISQTLAGSLALALPLVELGMVRETKHAALTGPPTVSCPAHLR